MLRHLSYNVVFQEVPDEVTLAINISNCPNHCKGCHSPYLWEDTGDILDETVISALLDKYGSLITCICFMGGDNDPAEVERLAIFVREKTQSTIKIAWYSGKKNFPDHLSFAHFNYLKLGPYIPQFGGLDSPTTNQRFYRITHGALTDITHRFLKTKI